jgi:hypothetical protein
LLVVIVGQALLFARWELLVYAAFFWAATAAFVRFYEEPTLMQQYGAEYEAYRRAVPAWIPRVRPRWASLAPVRHPFAVSQRQRPKSTDEPRERGPR